MTRSTLSITKTTPLARHGMVVAEHPRGAEVGARILERGGNAVDAAVATAFAMTVVEPFMSTIAGSGTMLVHLARRGQTVCLDFNAVAPADELLGAARELLGQILSKGPLAVQYALEATLRGFDMGLDDGLYMEATLFGMACGTDDMKEGTKAFLEKRKPEFRGR